MQWRVERAAKRRAILHVKARKVEQRKGRRSEFDAFSEGQVPAEKLQLFPKYQKPEETSDGEIKLLHEHLCGPRGISPVHWYLQKHAFDTSSSEMSGLNPDGSTTGPSEGVQQPSSAPHPPEQLQSSVLPPSTRLAVAAAAAAAAAVV